MEVKLPWAATHSRSAFPTLDGPSPESRGKAGKTPVDDLRLVKAALANR